MNRNIDILIPFHLIKCENKTKNRSQVVKVELNQKILPRFPQNRKKNL